MKKILALIVGLMSTPCWAYYEVLDTGEIMAPGHYKLTATGQALTSTGGANVAAIFDAGFQEQYGVRAIAGFGHTDYFLGTYFKWMPIPDMDSQPAIGFNLGLLYAKQADVRDLNFRFEPLLSKKFSGDTLVLTPYVTLPFGLRTRNSETQDSRASVTWQLAVGSQVQIERWKNLQFMGEIGLDLENAVSYVSAAAVWYFDQENGFQLK